MKQGSGVNREVDEDRATRIGQSTTLNRRDFLAATSFTAGLTALGGCLVDAADQLMSIEDVDEWIQARDVLIVGGGGAGTCAALEVAAAGGTPLVLEKDDEPGGDTRMSGGRIFMGGGTGLQEQLGVEDSVEELVTYLQSRHGRFMSDERIQTFAERSAENYDWLVDHGTEFYEEGFDVPCCFEFGLTIAGAENIYPHRLITEAVPRSHHVRGDGAGLFEAIYTSAQDEGIEYVTNAEVTALVENEDERIVGIEAQVGGDEQETRHYMGEQAVIMATGGFQANDQMVERHLPDWTALQPLDVPRVHDGSGIQMGTSAGAATHGLQNAFGVLFLYPPFSALEGLLINKNGVRFVHEDAHGETLPVYLVEEEDQEIWLVIDDQIMQDVEQTENASLQSGNFEFVATTDTIAGLAEEIPPPTLTTENTVESYNKVAAEAGEDLAFHKHPQYVRPLDTPPYHAVRINIGTIVFATLGGLEIDAQARVLDGRGNPVEGLLGAGRVTSLSHRYDSGFALANMITWGRVAGETAAAMDNSA